MGYDSRVSIAAAGLASGLSLLWEKKSRRAELALFVVPRSADIAWNTLKAKRIVTPIHNGEVYLFSLAMAVIMMMYQHESTTFKPMYLKVMTRMFGMN